MSRALPSLRVSKQTTNYYSISMLPRRFPLSQNNELVTISTSSKWTLKINI